MDRRDAVVFTQSELPNAPNCFRGLDRGDDRLSITAERKRGDCTLNICKTQLDQLTVLINPVKAPLSLTSDKQPLPVWMCKSKKRREASSTGRIYYSGLAT